MQKIWILVLLVCTSCLGISQRAPAQEEAVHFSSIRNTEIKGTLYFPNSNKEKFPAIVAVHGSGKTTRNDSFVQEMVHHFTAAGYAVLAFDKRGVGKSGGIYLGSYSSSMLVYAMDATAGFDYLQKHPRIDKHKIGMAGLSQAGFIIPMAASILKEELAFSLIFSGPTVSIYEENLYSDLTGDTNAKPTNHSEEYIQQEMAKAPSLGYDPYPFMEEMTMPSLWVFGSLDKNIPVFQSVIDLAEIKKRWKRDFTWKVFEGGNHALKKARTGGSWERPVPSTTLEGVFPYVIKWLEANN